jgi:hypothetical protein
MSKFKLIALAAATLVGGCATDYGSRDRYADDGWGYYDRGYYQQYGSYDYNRPDPRYSGYYADRYYRQDSRYRERSLNENDRIYRGHDGRFYCRRSDGSTGLIVGAIGGGVLGNIIAEGDSKTLGTVLGAIGGAAVGAAIDSSSNNRVGCR